MCSPDSYGWQEQNVHCVIANIVEESSWSQPLLRATLVQAILLP